MKKKLESPSKEAKKPVSKKKIIVGVFLILFAFFGSFLIYFIMQVALNTQYPMVVVVSGSMEPSINKGDLLFLCGRDAENIKSGTHENKEGDVIVYDAKGLWAGAPAEPIVHRVVNKYQVGSTWYFETQGDANNYKDATPVPEDHVLGVVCGRVPYVGWVKIFLTETNIFIPLLIILAFLLIISIVWDIVKEEVEEEESESLKPKKLRKREIQKRESEDFVETIGVIEKKNLNLEKKEEPRSKEEKSSETADDFDF